MSNKKSDDMVSILTKKIYSGDFGKSGDTFLTVRELSKMFATSLVTAQKVMVLLRNKKLIKLVGKKHFLTYGIINARSELKKKMPHTRIIGFILSNINNPYFSLLARVAEVTAHKYNYDIIIKSSGYDLNEEILALELFEKIGVEGVLSYTSRDEGLVSYYKKYNIPYVFVSNKLDGLTADAICVDNCFGAEAVAEHFIKNNYKEFIYLTPSVTKDKDDARYRGFTNGLAKNGILFKEENRFFIANSGINEVFFESILKRFSKPLAIFCYHDLLAFEVINICKSRGIEIPNEVGICGFDNLSLVNEFCPNLTTVDYRIEKMVDLAVSTLVKRISGDYTDIKHQYIYPNLAVRTSTRK